VASLAKQFLAQHQAMHGDEAPLAVDQFVETLDRWLGPRCDEAHLPAPTTALEKALVKQIEAQAEARGAILVDWLYKAANSPATGVQGAFKAAEWFVQHLRGVERESREAAQAQRQEALAFEQILRGAPLTESRATVLGLSRGKKGMLEHADVLSQMALRRVAELSLRCVTRLVQAMSQRVNVVLEGLRNLRRGLTTLSEGFSPGAPLDAQESAPGLAGVHVAVGLALQAQLDDLTDELVERLPVQVLGDRGMRTLIEQPELLAQLPTLIRQSARYAVREALGKVDLAGWLLEDTESRLKDALAKAQPLLLAECGGSRRILICQPSNEAKERLFHAVREAFRVEPMLVPAEDPGLLICCEAEKVSTARIADCLADEWIELPQMAARVRTRIDVTWMPLPG
jgi:hypothetical protein